MTTFLPVISNSIIYKFFKDFTNHRKKTNRAVVFSSRPFLSILNTGTTNETLQQSGKQDLEPFRHILKSPASMYESLGHSSLILPLEYKQDETPLIN